MAVDSRAEYWENVQIPAGLDLVELLPAHAEHALRDEDGRHRTFYRH